MLGATLAAPVRIQLCGTLAVEIDGRRLDHDLPGRHGRLLLAYLVLHRMRGVRRDELRLSLPADAFVDLEDAREAIHRAESALAQGQWHRAWGASLGPLFTARRGFLPDEDAEWIRDTRHELDAPYRESGTAT
jgi:hypothetical protein